MMRYTLDLGLNQATKVLLGHYQKTDKRGRSSNVYCDCHEQTGIKVYAVAVREGSILPLVRVDGKAHQRTVRYYLCADCVIKWDTMEAEKLR